MPSGSNLDSNWWENLPTEAAPTYQPVGLPSRDTVSPIGFLPSGGSGSDLSAASALPWGKIIGAGAGLIPALFAGGGSSLKGPIGEVQRGARQLGATGKGLAQQGEAALAPALKYFQDLLSGNPADIEAATAPQRRRVIDQYDTARKSSAEFTPRGGGQASAQMESRAREASDLATVGASARDNAANTVSSLGKGLLDSGISAEQEATNQLAQVLGPLFQQQQADQQSTAQTFAGIASLIAAFL